MSLIGSFAVMAAVGISFNTLSLFGLVLAIGIVVDDAIVVVENVERYLQPGHVAASEAAHKTMDEVGGALIAIALVLCAVFMPTAFITGLQGSFYRAVRHHHRRGDGDLGLRLADAVAGAGGAAAEAARGTQPRSQARSALSAGAAPVTLVLRRLQLGFERCRTATAALTARLVRVGVDRAGGLCRADLPDLLTGWPRRRPA